MYNVRPCSEPAAKFRHAVVSDLAWAVSSPPLLLDAGGDCCWPDSEWYRAFYAAIEPELVKLDRNPRKLQELVSAEKDQRLGKYFETLWRFALQLHPRFILRERNLQVIDGGTTVGEFDFIVEDTKSGELVHWELAIKFYLGCGELHRLHSWTGPRKRDRLDRKLVHLISRQTQLRRHPLAAQQLAEKEMPVELCMVIVKGVLFYPLDGSATNAPVRVNKDHVRGRWATLQQFRDSVEPGDHFRPLPHSGWLSGIPTARERPVLSADELLGHVGHGDYRLPLYLCALKGRADAMRMFIVDDSWRDDPA